MCSLAYALLDLNRLCLHCCQWVVALHWYELRSWILNLRDIQFPTVPRFASLCPFEALGHILFSRIVYDCLADNWPRWPRSFMRVGLLLWVVTVIDSSIGVGGISVNCILGLKREPSNRKF